MVPREILSRVLYIFTPTRRGSATTFESAGRQMLLTASHVVEGVASNSEIEVFRHGATHRVPIGTVWHAPSGADVAVLELKSDLTARTTIEVGPPSKFFLSQPTYFLGFPYGLKNDAITLNDGYPIAFVKSGIVAGFETNSGISSPIYLDGHNNPGFSGGPICTVDKDHRVAVVGVVSEMSYVDAPVFEGMEEIGLTVESHIGLVRGFNLVEVVTAFAR